MIYFPPFKTFSHSFFFQSNCYPVSSAGCPPSALPHSIKGTMARHHHPHPRVAWRRVMLSIPLDFIVSPPFQFFSHHFSVQLLFSQHAGCPPSVNQRNKVLQPPSLPVGCAEKAVMVIFPLVFILSPPLEFFSHGLFFQLSCYSAATVSGCFSF